MCWSGITHVDRIIENVVVAQLYAFFLVPQDCKWVSYSLVTFFTLCMWRPKAKCRESSTVGPQNQCVCNSFRNSVLVYPRLTVEKRYFFGSETQVQPNINKKDRSVDKASDWVVIDSCRRVYMLTTST